jgi:hypothetical protein
MKQKNFIDMYKRNFKGTFFGGFFDPQGTNFVVPFIWIGHIALLPLTLTFGAGIKTLIDFFTRREIPEETINAVDGAIDALDAESIRPLIESIAIYRNGAQSTSSKKLIQMLLHTIPGETIDATSKDLGRKKRELQEAQLGININPELRKRYRPSYIANLPLNEESQRQLDAYIAENRVHTNTQQLSKQKGVIKEYLGADHNYGKKMQQIICNYFFPPVTTVVAPQQSDDITALPPIISLN